MARSDTLAEDARILIVRLSAIGDIVFASPIVAALRRTYPKAHIAWLVQPECAALLDHHPDLNETIVCPMGHWRRLWRERRLSELARGIGTLRATLRERRFDLALDLQGLAKSGLLAWLSGAPRRIGLGSREGSQWLMTRVIARGGDPQRIGSEYLYLAETLGLPAGTFPMAVHYSATDTEFAAETLAHAGIAGGYAVLCPFTTRPQKHWTEDRWATLAARLRAELGVTPVLLGGPGDEEAGRRIADDCDGILVNLTGRTSLTEAAALIDGAELLVAVDTGLGHMGLALGTPSVLLFGSTCPYTDTTRTNARVLYHRLPCSPCKRRPTCGGAFTCMREISVGEVARTARRSSASRPDPLSDRRRAGERPAGSVLRHRQEGRRACLPIDAREQLTHGGLWLGLEAAATAHGDLLEPHPQTGLDAPVHESGPDHLDGQPGLQDIARVRESREWQRPDTQRLDFVGKHAGECLAVPGGPGTGKPTQGPSPRSRALAGADHGPHGGKAQTMLGAGPESH